MEKRVLQWHPAFQAALQIELLENREDLEFLKEYNLSEKPLQMDTLIIKQNHGCRVKKSIGRIFREHNIVEYKSPEDYLSVNDFYKVLAYACLYQSGTERVMEIPPQEVTVTLVENHYPRALARHLEQSYGASVTKAYPGIYYVTGLMFPTQIVVTESLSADEYVWLSRLRSDLTVEADIEPLAVAYKGKEKNPLFAAAMDLIIRANRRQYEEGKKMCDALRELFADEIAESETKGLEKGKMDAILELLADLGPIPDDLREKIYAQTDLATLTVWLKAAAKAESMQDFRSRIEAAVKP